jgi:hypothetical protein
MSPTLDQIPPAPLVPHTQGLGEPGSRLAGVPAYPRVLRVSLHWT